MITDGGRKKIISKKQMLNELKKVGYSNTKAQDLCLPR